MPPKKQKAPVIFESVSHPLLETLDPADAVRFIREREVYETEIAERENDGTAIQPASYRVSVDPIILRSVHAMGYFYELAPDVGVENLTEYDIRKFIKGPAEAAATEEPNSSIIEETLKGLRMKISIINPRAHVYQLALEYDLRMADVCCGSFRDDNPKKAIELLTDAMHPPALKMQMKNDLDYMPNITKDCISFLSHAAKQAEHVQRGSDSAARVTKATPRTEKNSDAQKPSKGRREKTNGTSHQLSESNTAGDKKSRELPKCLNQECKELHYLKDCKNTPEEAKSELLKKFREEKADKREKNAKAVRASATTRDKKNSTLFRACYAELIERVICADIGSDINLLPPSLLRELQSRDAHMRVVKFKKTRSYGLADEENIDGAKISILCDQQVTLDMQLFIRHGCTLWLRNITWYVATKELPEALLGRHVLDALGLDAHEALEAATIAHEGSDDVGKLLQDVEAP